MDEPTVPAFRTWRRVHRAASFTLAAVATAHSALTFMFYNDWSPNAVWFLGTGLGLLLLAAMNLAHVGLEPCRLSTARAVKAANWVFALFGVGALVAVAEPQALVIVVALFAQAVASLQTLPSS